MKWGHIPAARSHASTAAHGSANAAAYRRPSAARLFSLPPANASHNPAAGPKQALGFDEAGSGHQQPGRPQAIRLPITAHTAIASSEAITAPAFVVDAHTPRVSADDCRVSGQSRAPPRLPVPRQISPRPRKRPRPGGQESKYIRLMLRVGRPDASAPATSRYQPGSLRRRRRGRAFRHASGCAQPAYAIVVVLQRLKNNRREQNRQTSRIRIMLAAWGGDSGLRLCVRSIGLNRVSVQPRRFSG